MFSELVFFECYSIHTQDDASCFLVVVEHMLVSEKLNELVIVSFEKSLGMAVPENLPVVINVFWKSMRLSPGIGPNFP